MVNIGNYFISIIPNVNQPMKLLVTMVNLVKIGNWPHGDTAQCGKYGNLLSRFFGKNFVKAMHLLNKSLKSWFDGKNFQWEWIFYFSTDSTVTWKFTKFTGWLNFFFQTFRKFCVKSTHYCMLIVKCNDQNQLGSSKS